MKNIVVDMMGRSICVPQNPQRIVSLVPSQTEFLFSLGLGDRIVGVTRFCVHPETARRTAQVVGGTKQLDIERILQLQPDLVIGNKEENDAETIHALDIHVPVWMSDIYTIPDAYTMMSQIGELVQKKTEANLKVDEIKLGWQNWLTHRPAERKSALYLIWANPWMAAARSTFINSMLEMAGLVNVLDQDERYPVLERSDFQFLEPDLILLSSEPFPFKEKHAAELTLLLPNATILFVDGEMFTWYGSRLALVPQYFKSLMQKVDKCEK